jgi:prefoldin subunit 5
MHKTYTQKEIDSALNVLKTDEENLLLTRKELNQVIREKRKNIKYYEDLDLSQYRAF